MTSLRVRCVCVYMCIRTYVLCVIVPFAFSLLHFEKFHSEKETLLTGVEERRTGSRRIDRSRTISRSNVLAEIPRRACRIGMDAREGRIEKSIRPSPLPRIGRLFRRMAASASGKRGSRPPNGADRSQLDRCALPLQVSRFIAWLLEVRESLK